MSKELKSETAWARWRYEQIQKAKVYAVKVQEDPVWLANQERRYKTLESRSRK